MLLIAMCKAFLWLSCCTMRGVYNSICYQNHPGLAPGIICTHLGVLAPWICVNTSLITLMLAAKPHTCGIQKHLLA